VQQPLFSGPKGGCCKQAWLFKQKNTTMEVTYLVSLIINNLLLKSMDIW
jgi:hypothetical protein